MKQNEPTLGKADEMARMEFRPNANRLPPRTAEKRSDGLAWKIALGVAAGMVISFTLITCTGLVVTGAVIEEVHKQSQENAEKAAEEFIRAVNDPDPFGIMQQQAERQAAEAERQRRAKALRAGERCIQGQRFRRVENGWEQVYNRPC